jgi:hypothetical protein
LETFLFFCILLNSPNLQDLLNLPVNNKNQN